MQNLPARDHVFERNGQGGLRGPQLYVLDSSHRQESGRHLDDQVVRTWPRRTPMLENDAGGSHFQHRWPGAGAFFDMQRDFQSNKGRGFDVRQRHASDWSRGRRDLS